MKAIWGVVDLGNDHWALRAPNGLYLSARPEGQLFADALFLGEREIFTVEQCTAGMALRTNNGRYLTKSADHDVRLSRRGEPTTFLVTDPFAAAAMAFQYADITQERRVDSAPWM
jgi:hypothetical protein